MLKFVENMENVLLVFTERQNLVAFLQIMKLVFQQLEKEDFYMHSFIRASTYIIISRHFIRISIICWLSSEKSNYFVEFIDLFITSFNNNLYAS